MENRFFIFISALLLVGALFNTNCLKCFATQETSTNYQLKQKIEMESIDYIDEEGDLKEYLEPCYGDYEILNQSPIALYSDDAREDQYESNNSFSNATAIQNSINNHNNYAFSIYATLHRNEWLWGLIKRDIDEDYYRFDLMGNAKVEITLSNIPEGKDYDLDLSCHDNRRYSESDSVSLVKQSRKASNTTEKINIEVGPGTYYLRVYPYENSFSASQEYKLSGLITYTSKSASISEMKFNNGAKGALWVSDYDPFSYAPLSTFKNEEVGVIAYDTSGTSIAPLNIQMYNNPYFHYLGQNKSITQTIFYLWDESWRKEIFDFLKEFERVLTRIVDKNTKLRIEIEKILEVIDGITTISGIVLNLSDMSVGICLDSPIFGVVLEEAPSIIAQLIYPEAYDTTQFYMLEHVRYLKNAFERTLNPTINEAIKITSSYSIETQTPPLLLQWNYYCNFTPTYDHNGYSTLDDVIPFYTRDTVFHGTTYAIRNKDDISKALNKSDILLENINTGGDQELFLDNYGIEAKHLLKGEYHWYHFKAPESGQYKFYTINSMDTYGELFNEIVPAHETEGRLKFNDDSGDALNFSIIYPLLKGQTIYLRISGFNWNRTGSYTPLVSYYSSLNTTSQIIHPYDFGYKNEYVDEITNDKVDLENGFSFNTERYRCGYINKSYLALSAKRKDVDSAWITFDFNKQIYSIDFYIGLWSSEEYINSSNAYILFQYASEDGKWKTAIDFDLNSISKNKDNLDYYKYDFSSRVTKLRFYVHTNQVNYEKNKGRVVLGDISISYGG